MMRLVALRRVTDHAQYPVYCQKNGPIDHTLFYGFLGDFYTIATVFSDLKKPLHIAGQVRFTSFQPQERAIHDIFH
jgi:hypothetical protein